MLCGISNVILPSQFACRLLSTAAPAPRLFSKLSQSGSSWLWSGTGLPLILFFLVFPGCLWRLVLCLTLLPSSIISSSLLRSLCSSLACTCPWYPLCFCPSWSSISLLLVSVSFRFCPAGLLHGTAWFAAPSRIRISSLSLNFSEKSQSYLDFQTLRCIWTLHLFIAFMPILKQQVRFKLNFCFYKVLKLNLVLSVFVRFLLGNSSAFSVDFASEKNCHYFNQMLFYFVYSRETHRCRNKYRLK